MDAALLYPFADAGGPSLAVRLALEELPGLSVVRSVGLSCSLHEHVWSLSVAAQFGLHVGNDSVTSPLSVGVSGSWVLGGAFELSAAQATSWEAPFGLSWLSVSGMSVSVHGGNGTGLSVAASGGLRVSCGDLNLPAGATIEVGSRNGSTSWRLTPDELPPASCGRTSLRPINVLVAACAVTSAVGLVAQSFGLDW